MLKTMLGVILLLIPFLLLYRFKDKKLGFAYILSFLMAFHLALAVITQAFGVFSWSLVVIVSLIADIIVLTRINFRELKAEIKKEIEEMFKVKVESIRTCIRLNKKYAYTKLNKKNPAIDVATKLGMI